MPRPELLEVSSFRVTEHLAHRVQLLSDSQTFQVCLSRVNSAQQGCGNVLCNDHIDTTLGTSISGEGGKWVDRHLDLHFKTPRFWGGIGASEIVHLSGSEFPQDSKRWRRSDSDSLLPGLSRACRTEGFLSCQREWARKMEVLSRPHPSPCEAIMYKLEKARKRTPQSSGVRARPQETPQCGILRRLSRSGHITFLPLRGRLQVVCVHNI